MRTLQRRQGPQVACLEKIAYLHGSISREQLIVRGALFKRTPYGQNLCGWRARPVLATIRA